MTFFGLARRNAWRKPFRTILLLFSVAIAFFIFGVTESFVEGSQSASEASEDLLGVMSAAGRAQALPSALRVKLETIPDVAAVSVVTRLRGYVGEEKNRVSLSAVDAQSLLAVHGRELALTPEHIRDFTVQRDMILVGRALARSQGWTIGQRVTVTMIDVAKVNGGKDWSFQIAGVFDGASDATDTYFALANYTFVNESRRRGRDTVDAFVVRPRPGVSAGALAARIDTQFAETATPTRTRSEKQFLEAFFRQYADVGLIVTLVLGAAFITLLMIILNTMLFAIRERRFEIGLLKTVGFSSWQVVGLVLTETLFVFIIGAGWGMLLAKGLTVLADPSLGLVFSAQVFLRGLLVAVGLGLATGAVPALNALRIPVSAAIRR